MRGVEIGSRCAMTEINIAIAALEEDEGNVRVDAAVQALHLTNHEPMIAHFDKLRVRAFEIGRAHV